MNGETARGGPDRTDPPQPSASDAGRPRVGLGDPRAVNILTTEHWGYLSTRTLGYQEMFGRATIFIGILSATVVALALLAQATHFGRETLSIAALMLSVALLIGIATFVRSVAINYEDARCVAGMNRLRQAYVEIVPELEPFFIVGRDSGPDPRSLGHGSPQRLANLANSLTTTSGVVGALNSILVGTLASDLGALLGGRLAMNVGIGAAVSLASAVLHTRYAARFRRLHVPSTR
jgi:hypothetical protein